VYISPAERVVVLIDGPKLYAVARSLGFDIDYRRLLTYFRSKSRLVRALYYTTIFEDQEFVSIRPLVDWLEYNGFTLVTKPAKEFIDSEGRRRVKSNMNVELAVDAMQMAESVDHFILFTGDGEFRRLVEALQRSGKRVSVISTISTQPPMIADELRRQADQFIDLVELESEIGRNPAPNRATPETPVPEAGSIEDASELEALPAAPPPAAEGATVEVRTRRRSTSLHRR
jgi:uncharacterized LabA/DUF88 family protein